MNSRLTPIHRLALVALATLGVASAPAQDRINLRAWFVEATDAQITTALAAAGADTPPALVPAGKVDAVVTALGKAGATILAQPRALTNGGQRVTIESVRELIYPSTYAPSPKDPTKFVGTEFVTRNVGQSLAVEPVADPASREITLALQVSVTDFLGFVDAGSVPERTSAEDSALQALLRAPLREGTKWQPLFAVWRVESTITLPSGGATIIGGAPEEARSGEVPRRARFLLLTAELLAGN